MFARAAGAPLVGGNAVRVLRDAGGNYPVWLSAIAAARQSILFENYILADDRTGREFVAAMTERARAGVAVRLIYDWMGALGVGTQRLLQPLIEAGGKVRCFNSPRFDSPFGWLTRDHRASRRGQASAVPGHGPSGNIRATIEWTDRVAPCSPVAL